LKFDVLNFDNFFPGHRVTLFDKQSMIDNKPLIVEHQGSNRKPFSVGLLTNSY